MSEKHSREKPRLELECNCGSGVPFDRCCKGWVDHWFERVAFHDPVRLLYADELLFLMAINWVFSRILLDGKHEPEVALRAFDERSRLLASWLTPERVEQLSVRLEVLQDTAFDDIEELERRELRDAFALDPVLVIDALMTHPEGCPPIWRCAEEERLVCQLIIDLDDDARAMEDYIDWIRDRAPEAVDNLQRAMTILEDGSLSEELATGLRPAQ